MSMDTLLDLLKVAGAALGAYWGVRLELRLLWKRVERIEARLDSLFVPRV